MRIIPLHARAEGIPTLMADEARRSSRREEGLLGPGEPADVRRARSDTEETG